jgi:hypothetical protein
MTTQPSPVAEPVRPRPQDKLSIMVKGQETTFFMSFSTLNALTRIIGDFENVAAAHVDVATREELATTILKIKFKAELKDRDFDIEEFAMTAEDGEKLINWIAEHILDFFIRGLEEVNRLAAHNKTALKGLLSSVTGSNDSTSPKDAASPST